MLPVIALVGRPNVGKSTLFNCLTRTRNALVADIPGLTRDRQYGEGEFEQHRFMVIDTGGISVGATLIQDLSYDQTQQALQEADLIFFIVDAKAGLTPEDEIIAKTLRPLNKPLILVVNKMDGPEKTLFFSEFYSLGISSEPIGIAAAHNQGLRELMEQAIAYFPAYEALEESDSAAIRFAIVGRPNVGKSTLVNRMLGTERVIASQEPGTTRDSIYIPFLRHDQSFMMIDTAGLRRRGKVTETIEKFSMIKTLQAIDRAQIIIFLINAQEGVVDYELRLLGYILERGKGIIIAINKWDGLQDTQKQQVKNELARRLHFLNFADQLFISALHGTGVGHLFTALKRVYRSLQQTCSPSRLTDILQAAVEGFQPPMSHGHRIKLRYAHMGGNFPPQIIIHGNQTEALPDSYRRYLMNQFMSRLKLKGTPVILHFKTGDNPFKDKKNVLTPRQKAKRKRIRKRGK